jgi:hypothetical protein
MIETGMTGNLYVGRCWNTAGSARSGSLIVDTGRLWLGVAGGEWWQGISDVALADCSSLNKPPHKYTPFQPIIMRHVFRAVLAVLVAHYESSSITLLTILLRFVNGLKKHHAGQEDEPWPIPSLFKPLASSASTS